jgi:hypothetical protein
MDDVNALGGIIPAIKEQLVLNPESELPEWLSEEFPDLYDELKRKYNL